MEKGTKELINELRKTADILDFVKVNERELETLSLTDHLEQYLIKYGKAKRDIIKDAWLDTTYGYQIFDGKKKPRRDKILQLAFGFPLSVEDTNILLRAGGMNSLYIRSKRDAICMYCLQQQKTIDECNEMLYKAGEETF